MLSDRVIRIAASPTMKVAAEAKRLKTEGVNVIDLSVGEPDFPTPQNIKDAAKKAIDENHTKYTINSGTIELRKAIIDKFKKDNNLDYNLNEIIVSSGAKQSIFNAILSTVSRDDEVIVPAPYWVSYPEMISLAEGKTVVIETCEENGFRISPEQLEKAITPKTRLFILCNPSNPTGSTYNREQLEGLAEVIKKYDFLVLSDEIYEKLLYDNFEFISFASLNEEMKRRTILVNGVSKTYSMTGWRIGYTAGPEEVIKAMDKIQSHSTSHASSISQQATIESLNGPHEYLKMMQNEFHKRRDYLYDKLLSVEGVTCYKPEGAFYLFPNLSYYMKRSMNGTTINNSMDLAMYLLNEAKIALVPGSAFGAEGFMRF
ncbi:MAG TPA: pyridoxal phosphate-dependent aminotransferase, partial [Ignavibacteriaceae bacterium]|nr:pyridoxal phosphate-dependent aminotransferase [Ignavibacteriaceae bacterium]